MISTILTIAGILLVLSVPFNVSVGLSQDHTLFAAIACFVVSHFWPRLK